MKQVRAATLADAPGIGILEGWSTEEVERTLRAPATLAFVACDGDELVGDVLATGVAGTGEILRITTRADRRRERIGELLLGVVEAAWGAAGVGTAFLEVRVDNAPAIGLYTKRGWVVAHRRKAYYRDGCDALLMRWGPEL